VVTDGVEFQARFVGDDDRIYPLFKMYLDPVHNPRDRGLQRFEADLPLAHNGELILSCLAGSSDVMDWSCWGIPEFK